MVVALQSTKVETIIAPATVTIASGASTYGYIDCIGWDALKVIAISAIEASSSDAYITLKITEGTNSTAASAIVALTGGTSVVTDSTGFVIPIYNSSEGQAVVFDLDLRKRERYLRVHVVPGDPSTFAVIGILSRGEAMPGSDLGSVPAAAQHIIE